MPQEFIDEDKQIDPASRAATNDLDKMIKSGKNPTIEMTTLQSKNTPSGIESFGDKHITNGKVVAL